jgi:hypothetical protein
VDGRGLTVLSNRDFNIFVELKFVELSFAEDATVGYAGFAMEAK